MSDCNDRFLGNILNIHTCKLTTLAVGADGSYILLKHSNGAPDCDCVSFTRHLLNAVDFFSTEPAAHTILLRCFFPMCLLQEEPEAATKKVSKKKAAKKAKAAAAAAAAAPAVAAKKASKGSATANGSGPGGVGSRQAQQNGGGGAGDSDPWGAQHAGGEWQTGPIGSQEGEWETVSHKRSKPRKERTAADEANAIPGGLGL